MYLEIDLGITLFLRTIFGLIRLGQAQSFLLDRSCSQSAFTPRRAENFE